MKCIIQEQIKTSHQISYNLMIICLKCISEKKVFVQCQCQYQPELPLSTWRPIIHLSSLSSLKGHLGTRVLKADRHWTT